MKDRNGQPLSVGDQVRMFCNHDSLVFEDCEIIQILTPKNPEKNQVALVKNHKNILGNLFPCPGYNLIKKYEEGINPGTDEVPGEDRI